MREDECYNCVHLKEDHQDGQAECEILPCPCPEWIPFPDDESEGE